jgi:hypothetical protein
VRRELPGFLTRLDDKTVFAERLTGVPSRSSATPAAALPPASPDFTKMVIADLTDSELLQ